jgi:hypothetical protein
MTSSGTRRPGERVQRISLAVADKRQRPVRANQAVWIPLDRPAQPFEAQHGPASANRHLDNFAHASGIPPNRLDREARPEIGSIPRPEQAFGGCAVSTLINVMNYCSVAVSAPKSMVSAAARRMLAVQVSAVSLTDYK